MAKKSKTKVTKNEKEKDENPKQDQSAPKSEAKEKLEENKIKTKEQSYVATKEFLEKQGNNYNYTFLYYDAPAINSELEGVITSVNGVPITSLQIFQSELERYSPGDEVNIKTKLKDETTKNYKIVLDENPGNKDLAYLGVGFLAQSRSGVSGRIIEFMSSFRSSNVSYESKFGAGWFIYNLLWWLVLISFSIALVNMLPVGLFDGGRFFYLTVLVITKSEKKAKKTFVFVTKFFLFLLFVLMALWVFSFF